MIVLGFFLRMIKFNTIMYLNSIKEPNIYYT
jgi:hypothetical protein